jgi:hypothetical protein
MSLKARQKAGRIPQTGDLPEIEKITRTGDDLGRQPVADNARYRPSRYIPSLNDEVRQIS